MCQGNLLASEVDTMIMHLDGLVKFEPLTRENWPTTRSFADDGYCVATFLVDFGSLEVLDNCTQLLC